jgi:hypothetical protein
MATTTDPFAGMTLSGGKTGGVQLAGGEWVPADHPLANQAGATAAGAGTGAASTSGQPTMTTNGTIEGQAQSAQTYSTTPGGQTTQTTANQGTQDVVRNSYLAQATQGTQIDANDPNLRQQVAPFAAAVERQKRDFVSDQAEKSGPYATGALRGQERMASERAGQAIGGFEADLIGRELTNRRNEIQTALAALGDTISGDQARLLQKELADLQAQMQRLGIQTSADVSPSGQALQERLARLQDSYNYAQLGQQQRQFSDTLGFNIGATEASLNQQSLDRLFG